MDDFMKEFAKIDCDKCILQGTVFCNECKPIHDVIKSPVEVDDGDSDT